MRDREQEAHDLALRACRQQGCTCDVEITIETIEGLNTPAASVRHDDNCPLLRTMLERPPGPGRWQAVLRPPDWVATTYKGNLSGGTLYASLYKGPTYLTQTTGGITRDGGSVGLLYQATLMPAGSGYYFDLRQDNKNNRQVGGTFTTGGFSVATAGVCPTTGTALVTYP